MLKIISAIFFLLLFNGCLQTTALLGPAVTAVGTGNMYQAGLSYASGQTLTVITGKTAIENIKTLLDKDKNEEKYSENADNFFQAVNKINKNSGIKNLASQ